MRKLLFKFSFSCQKADHTFFNNAFPIGNTSKNCPWNLLVTHVVFPHCILHTVHGVCIMFIQFLFSMFLVITFWIFLHNYHMGSEEMNVNIDKLQNIKTMV